MTALQLVPDMERSAVFSEDRVFRYALRRIWDSGIPPVLFVAFNPSTADEEEDDPTVRRCLRYARDWGYGGLLVGNIFAYRATDPKKLPSSMPFPDGESTYKGVHPSSGREIRRRNEEEIVRMVGRSALVVAAWGAIKPPEGWEHQAERIRVLLGDCAHALGLTSGGHPLHPLYVSASARPVPLPRHVHDWGPWRDAYQSLEVRSCRTCGTEQWD